MLIVTHIPKTGGTTLGRYLEDVYGERLYREYRLIPPPRLPLWRRALAALGSTRARIPARACCIIGQNRATKYLQAFPRALHAVWLRDPVDRVLSHFHFNVRHPEAVKPHWHGLSLEQFIEHPFVSNNQAWVLDGRPLSDFDFVGDFAQFDLSVRLFARQFGLPAPRRALRLNSNPDRSGHGYRVSEELRSRILELNSIDRRLYEEARHLFRRRVEASPLE